LIRTAGVDAEIHLFGGYSPHGFGLAAGHPTAGRWPELAAGWMRGGAFLTDKKRVAVRGTVKVDAMPMGWGWVTLLPAESDAAPPACVMVHSKDGSFEIPAEHGTVPGRHRVEIRMVSRRVFRGWPSLEDAILLTRTSPDAPKPIEVTIVEGENVLDLDVRTTEAEE